MGHPAWGRARSRGRSKSLLDEPYFHRSLDDFRRGYPERFWLADDGTLFRSMLNGYLRALLALAISGHNVIAEAVVTPERLEDYLSIFAEVPVLFVGVHCPLPEAQRRERARHDRVRGPIELAAPPFERVHAHGIYDVEVDTSLITPREAARQIKAVLASPPAPTAFERLRAQTRRGGVGDAGRLQP